MNHKLVERDALALQRTVGMILDGNAERDHHRHDPVVGQADRGAGAIRMMQRHRARSDAIGVGGDHHVLGLAPDVEIA